MKQKSGKAVQGIPTEEREVIGWQLDPPLTVHIPYCSTRRGLEQQTWRLVSELAWQSSQLLRLNPKHRAEFSEIKAKCDGLREQIIESRRDLQMHRDDHGC